MSQSNLEDLKYLFDRPAQPIFWGKGSDASVNFSIPTSYFSDRYKPISSQVIQARGPGTATIPIREFPPPDISVPQTLDKRENFSVFNNFHKECAASLINTLLNIKNIDEFKSACVYIQQRVNPYLYIYALSVAMLHRKDTRNFTLPSHACTFPELYFDSRIINAARSEGTIVASGSRIPIEISRNLTASDLDVEHRLAYFREDIGVNLHHWHWHLVYPSSGPDQVVNKDRRGELFYYMHQQIMARYNVERFCNNLPRVRSFVNYRHPIPEGYFPKLDSIIASRVHPARQANAVLSYVSREADQTTVGIEDLERWRERIFEAINRGSIIVGADLTPLTEENGIDILGNIIEASTLSRNANYYGNLHNMGHMIIAYIHDPDNRFLETFGVIGDNTTAMRDPMFYRWHGEINRIFEEHKHTLPPYTTQQLNFDGILITEIKINTDELNTANTLVTYWERDQVDLSRGLDFTPSGPVFAAFTHLQHRSFSYNITVDNNGSQRVGTVRIFLGPKYDERGLTYRFRDQKGFFIELDRFTTTLRSGRNTIQRRSTDSSVTIPFQQTFQSLDETLTGGSAEQNFCGCGWPHYMLIPKGTQEGYPCELFVMITNYDTDRVDNNTMDSSSGGCDNAFSFCGVRNGRYPDRRPMGYPFDRVPRSGVVTLNQFLTSNMRLQDVTIRFNDRTLDGRTFQRQGTNQSSRTGTTTSTASVPSNQSSQKTKGKN